MHHLTKYQYNFGAFNKNQELFNQLANLQNETIVSFSFSKRGIVALSDQGNWRIGEVCKKTG